jgi:murein DD-endopeptidase MepM/ murein hydrolase activator NlpD
MPFALNAYAEPRTVAAVEAPSEEFEPLPPSYERAGLSERAPIDSTEIVWDATSFRSSNRELRARQHAARAGKYVLPVDPAFVTLADLVSPHHDYPAADLGIPMGSDVYAAHAGTVETVTQRGRCGRGVVIAGLDGYSYIYCHGAEVVVEVDQEVKAGELIMFSGNTGHSTGPHLHFGIETGSGTKVCPQSLLASWYDGGEASPDGAESTGCFYKPHNKKRNKRGERRTHRGAESVYSRSDDGSDGGGGGGDGSKPAPRPEPSYPLPTPTPTPSPTPTPEPPPSPDPEVSATADADA